MPFRREIITAMLETGYWRDHILANYLVEGLYSTLLAPPSPEKTITMMIVPPKSDALKYMKNSVAPHNHSYDLEIYVICGKIRNEDFLEAGNDKRFVDTSLCEADEYYEYSYFEGKIQQHIKQTNLYFLSNQEYHADSVFSMKREQIHSVNVGYQWEPAIWVRIERNRVSAPTRLFSKNQRIVGSKIATDAYQVDDTVIETFLEQAAIY